MQDNNITMDKDILLLSIEANSNNFIEYIMEEDLIRLGKSYQDKNEFLMQWLANGRSRLRNKRIERMR
jgi:hypothetical protein